MTNEDTTDFDEHFAKISSYIVGTLHGVPLEMTEDEKEQFRIQVISNQYAERLLSEAEKTETYRGLSKIDILHTVSIPQLARTIPLKGLNLSLGQFTRNYTQTVKRAADNKRRYAPGWVHSTCLLRGFPKGAAPHLAHDFAEQSVVCYTLCRRCPENTVAAGEGKGI